MQFNPDNQDFQGEQEWDGPRQSWMIKLVMKTGLVRDESQANYVLISVAVVFFVLTVVVFASIGSPSGSGDLGSIDDIPVELREQLPPEFLEGLQNQQQ